MKEKSKSIHFDYPPYDRISSEEGGVTALDVMLQDLESALTAESGQ